MNLFPGPSIVPVADYSELVADTNFLMYGLLILGVLVAFDSWTDFLVQAKFRKQIIKLDTRIQQLEQKKAEADELR